MSHGCTTDAALRGIMTHIYLILFQSPFYILSLIVFFSQALTSWSRCSWFLTLCQCWERRTGRTCYRWRLSCWQTSELVLHIYITSLSSCLLSQITTAELWKCFAVILSQVMPSYVSHGWKVKKPFRDLLPEVDSQGEMIAWRLRNLKIFDLEGRFARVMQHLEKQKAYWNKLGRILSKISHLIFLTSSLSCGLPGTYLDLQPHGQVNGRGSPVSPLPPAVLLPGGRAHVLASIPHRRRTGGQPHHWAEP